MIALIILFVAYILSGIVSYLLLRYNFKVQTKLPWTRTDRTIAIIFAIIPLIGLLTSIIVTVSNSEFWKYIGLFGNDEVKW